MDIPNEKIAELIKALEADKDLKVISTEVLGRGHECPYCHSMLLEHDNEYPRFRSKTFFKRAATIFMTRCLSCKMLFDEPIYLKDPWVVFRTNLGHAAYNLKGDS